ncbi:hypothetical protein PENTCL1PPCAC_24947, partial [Pristionchus entomophagus]
CRLRNCHPSGNSQQDFAAADRNANDHCSNSVAIHDRRWYYEECTRTRDLHRPSYCAEACRILTSLLSLALIFLHIL